MTAVHKGQRYVWHPQDDEFRYTVFIQITRVARDYSWADISCCTCYVAWTKRQPLPLPPGTVLQDWTLADVEASEP